jgi:hypothetical protein
LAFPDRLYPLLNSGGSFAKRFANLAKWQTWTQVVVLYGKTHFAKIGGLAKCSTKMVWMCYRSLNHALDGAADKPHKKDRLPITTVGSLCRKPAVGSVIRGNVLGNVYPRTVRR